MVQQQGEQLDKPPAKRGTFRNMVSQRLLIVSTFIVLVLVISTIWILSSLGIIPRPLATAFTTIFTVLGVIIPVVQALISSSSKPETQPPHTPSMPTLQPIFISQPLPTITQPLSPLAAVPDKMVHRSFLGLPPPTDPKTIQQRAPIVKEVYEKLIQPDMSAIVLTGIGGVGKSTLAALIYNYAEEQRRTMPGLFAAEPVWLRVDPAVTMTDLAGSIFAALGKPLPAFDNLAPHNQAVTLFNGLNTADQPRLVILDQFDNLLDRQTGHALVDRPGVAEWLDAINSKPCTCRILLTSRLWPQGTYEQPPIYMREHPIQGFGVTEGMELLRKQGIVATDAELRTAVTRCAGHALALMLLASLLRSHGLTLATLAEDPVYAQLWTGNIARNLLDYIYTQQLNEIQRKLLLAFSTYREPVSVSAALAVIDGSDGIPQAQLLEGLTTLLAQHLLEASGGGLYQLHSIVASYARSHFVEGNDSANRQALQTAHSRAAEYYLQRAARDCPPREKRRRLDDVHVLIEAIWQQCQAEQWHKAYELMEQEKLFSDLYRWGASAISLELYELLLPLEKWHLEGPPAARVYNNLGRAYGALWQKIETFNYYEKALSIHRAMKDRGGEATTLNNIGKAYSKLGQQAEALQWLEQALSLYREVKDRSGEGQIFNNLSDIYMLQGWQEKSLNVLEQALDIYREIGDSLGEGWTLNNLGKVCSALGQKEQARHYLETALILRRRIGPRESGRTLNHLGRVCTDLGEQEQALKHFEEALQMLREVGDRWGEGRVLDNLGHLSVVQGRREEARSYYEEALSIGKEVGDRVGQATVLNHLGQLSAALGESKAAQQYQKEALQISRQLEDHVGEGQVLHDLGLLSFEQGKTDNALACFLLARNLFEEREHPFRSEAQKWIDDLCVKVGKEPFASLLAQVEPQAAQIVERAL